MTPYAETWRDPQQPETVWCAADGANRDAAPPSAPEERDADRDVTEAIVMCYHRTAA